MIASLELLFRLGALKWLSAQPVGGSLTHGLGFIMGHDRVDDHFGHASRLMALIILVNFLGETFRDQYGIFLHFLGIFLPLGLLPQRHIGLLCLQGSGFLPFAFFALLLFSRSN